MSLIPEAVGGLTNPLTTDLDFDGFKGINCLDPSAPQDLATKAYVDAGGGGGLFLPLAGGTMTGAIDFSGVTVNTLTKVGQIVGIGGTANLNITAAGSGDLILETATGDAILNGASVGIGNTDAAGGIAINSVYGSTVAIDTSGSVLVGSVIEPATMTVYPPITSLKGVVVANPTGQAGAFKAFDVSGIESTGSDAYGLYVNQLQSTANDTYGVYIGDMAAVNDAYGIYENTDPAFTTNPPKNYFRNNVGIGKDPTEALDVSGNTRVTAGNMAVNSYTESASLLAPAFQASDITSTVSNGTAIGFVALNINQTDNTSDSRAYGFGAVGVSTDGSGGNVSVASGFVAETLTANGTNGKASGIIISDLIANGAGGKAVGVEVNGDLSGATSYGIWEHSDTNNTINVLAHPLVIGNSLATATNVALDVSGAVSINGNVSVNSVTDELNGVQIIDTKSAVDTTIALYITGTEVSSAGAGNAAYGINIDNTENSGTGPSSGLIITSTTAIDGVASGIEIGDVNSTNNNGIGLDIKGIITGVTAYGIYERADNVNLKNEMTHPFIIELQGIGGQSNNVGIRSSAFAKDSIIGYEAFVRSTGGPPLHEATGMTIDVRADASDNGLSFGLNVLSCKASNDTNAIIIADTQSANAKAYAFHITGDISGATGSYGIVEESATDNLINVLKHPLVVGYGGLTPPTTANAQLDVSGNALIKGTLDMSANKITNVANGTDPNDAVNLSQISSIVDPSGTYLKLIGGTLTGQLAIARDTSAVPHLLLTATNAGTTPINEEVFRDATLVAADSIHQKSYYGDSSAGTKREFVREVVTCRDPTNGNEDASITTSIMRAGTLTQYQRIDGLNNNIAIGRNAGLNVDLSGGTSVIAIGEQAGQNPLGGAVCIGDRAGTSFCKSGTVAIGLLAGNSNLKQRGVAIGESAGQSNLGDNSVAIGYRAGQLGNGFGVVAIGDNAGATSQSNYSVAVGTNAGATSQQAGAFAFGIDAGQSNQGTISIAMGGGAGRFTQGVRAIALGDTAGNTSQQQRCVAIGELAGQSNQSEYSIAIGSQSGNSTQGANSIAIGRNAGQTSIGADCIAIGRDSVVSSTGSTSNSVAVGFEAMRVNGSTGCVSIGYKANRDAAGANSVVIGSYSTNTTGSGSNSIAIGRDAVASSSTADSITINATGAAITANQAGLFVAPIRGVALGLGVGVLYYDSSTKEIQYSTD